jgi:replicative DNA helicase
MAPPHNTDAEAAVLGAVLLDNSQLVEARYLLSTEDFYFPRNGDIFRAMCKLADSRLPIDPITLQDQLSSDIGNEPIDRIVFMELMANYPAGAIQQYCRIVKHAASRRSVMAVLRQCLELVQTPGDTEQDLATIGRMVTEAADVNSISGHETMQPAGVVVREAAMGVLDRWDAAELGEAPSIGSPTGLVDLDDILGGLQPGKLYIVCARPAMGKTAFGLQIIQPAVKDKVGYLGTLEVGHDEIGRRLIASGALIPGDMLSRPKIGRIDPRLRGRLSEYVERMENSKLWIDDFPHSNPSHVMAKCRRLQQRYGQLGVIMVDYIQLMEDDTGRYESRQLQVSEFSRKMKTMAREFNCPVVVLAQLNRELERRSDRRPILSDLRDSGALEQDADVVMSLYRDEVYDEQTPDKGVAEVNVLKHRDGATKKIRLAFFGETVDFRTMAHTY